MFLTVLCEYGFFVGRFHADVASVVAQPDTADARPRTLDHLTFAYDESCGRPYQLPTSPEYTYK